MLANLNRYPLNYLILVKHSLPEIVSQVPARAWHLSQSGQTRCKTLAERLEDYSPNVIISSAEPKASETAQIIARRLDQPFSIYAGLQEHDRTGVGFVDKVQFDSSMKHFFEYPDQLVFGTETANQSLSRFSRAINSVESIYPDKNIVAVAHGTVITLFVRKYNAIEAFSFWRKLDLPSFVVLSRPYHKLEEIVERVV
jgi:broad specificity phosphatase PhoE